MADTDSKFDAFLDAEGKPALDVGFDAIEEATRDLPKTMSELEIRRRALLAQKAIFFALSDIALQLSSLNEIPRRAMEILQNLVQSNPLVAASFGAAASDIINTGKPSESEEDDEESGAPLTAEEIDRLAKEA